MSLISVFAQTTNTATNSSGGGAFAVLMLFYVAIIVFAIVCLWKIFQKAGQPGWAAIVPFYNTYIQIKMAGKPGWWFILYLIPIVNIIITLLVSMELAKTFGKSETFGVVGLWLFSFVGYAILAFGDATYTAPVTVE